MNGRKAKALRKEIYGDDSKRPKRVYGYLKGVEGIRNHPASPRAKYQALKRQAKCQ